MNQEFTFFLTLKESKRPQKSTVLSEEAFCEQFFYLKKKKIIRNILT